MRDGWIVGVLCVALSRVAFAETATAVIQGTREGSPIHGTATFTDSPEGLEVAVEVTGVPPGQHGLHVHEFGGCANDGKAAGGHYNPHGAQHGFLPEDGFVGAHAGDFGNIEIDQDGRGELDLAIMGLHVGDGAFTVGGRAVVLHEKPDDFSQPLGNAGGRIGCGTIVITDD